MTITHHPDVRRSLMTQKSFAEGLRALVLYTASIQDRIALARAAAAPTTTPSGSTTCCCRSSRATARSAPGCCSAPSRCRPSADRDSCSDYPIEQYVRDAKIDTLYEGTTAIQGQDLFFRKIVRDQGRALGDVRSDRAWLAARRPAGTGQLKEERELLQTGLADVGAIVATMVGDLTAAAPGRPDGDPRKVYKVGLNTTRLLMAFGDVICAWLLLRGAEVALDRLNEELAPAELAFYEGKVASARWFARTVLPKLAAERAIAEATDLAVMDLPEESF